jgi:hypothetical protein
MDGTGATSKKFVSLGQDRVQNIFSAADLSWSVAIYKSRGQEQFGFIAIDLHTCLDEAAVDLPSRARSASFTADMVEFNLEKGGKQSYPLRSGAP